MPFHDSLLLGYLFDQCRCVSNKLSHLFQRKACLGWVNDNLDPRSERHVAADRYFAWRYSSAHRHVAAIIEFLKNLPNSLKA